MSETLNWNLSVNVAGGPQLSAANALAVDGYDKLAVTVTKNGGTETVTVGPGTWAGISMLMIMPSTADKKVTYQSGAITAALDGTHILVGPGAVSLLGTGAAQLKFTNGTPADVLVDILVGRNAS